MDKRVEQFLSDHNLAEYNDNFIHIDFESFINLRPETISALVPNAADSTKLHNAVVSFINESEDIESVYVKTEDDLIIHDDEDVYEISTEETILPDYVKYVPIEKRKSQALIESLHPELTITKMPRIENAVSLNTELVKEEEDIEVIEMLSDTDDEQPQESYQKDEPSNDVMEVTEETPSDIRKQKNTFNKILKKLKLAEIHDLDMQILLANYSRNKKFDDRERTLLSEIVIKEVLIEDTSLLIRKFGFYSLAKAILKAFPGEPIKPYFRDITSFNKPVTNIDRGSLYTAYIKYQFILAKTGFPVAKPLKPKTWPKQKSIELKVQPTFNASTFHNVLAKEFVESREKRLKVITQLQVKHKFSTVRYVQEYKVLQSKDGYELIIQDAHHLYPNLKGFVPKFDIIARNIIQHAKELAWNDEYVIDLLKFATPNMSPDSAKLLAILLLPYVLPKASFKKNDQSVVKSPLSSAVQFIRLFKNAADETRVYEQLYKEDSRFIMGVLDVNLKMFGNFNNINRIVLKVGDTSYNFGNPLQAIEAYFKMFLGLQLQYPMYAQHIFDFFGWIAFDLQRSTTMYDLYQSALSYYIKFTGAADVKLIGQ